jgi:hypothetical protein
MPSLWLRRCTIVVKPLYSRVSPCLLVKITWKKQLKEAGLLRKGPSASHGQDAESQRWEEAKEIFYMGI